MISYLLRRIYSFNTFNVICIRFCIYVHYRSINKPLSSPFKGSYMLGSSDNYTTYTNTVDKIKNLNPIKVYDNLKEDKINILKEQKDKSGVYYLVNKINGHSYVGSSINLFYRMKNYINKNFLKSRQNIYMPIVKALLKYDQSNFSLLILEYVEPKSLA